MQIQTRWLYNFSFNVCVYQIVDHYIFPLLKDFRNFYDHITNFLLANLYTK